MATVTGGSPVKSIQRGVATLASGVAAVTISAVNTAKAFVLVAQYGTGGTMSYVGAVLTNSTTLTINSGGTNPQVAWQVIEYA